MKRFENDPVIKHVWIDGTEIDEDTEESLEIDLDDDFIFEAEETDFEEPDDIIELELDFEDEEDV